MIVPRTTREEILGKLGAKMDRRDPIFIASAGSGLAAKLLEKAGVDCINTFSGARLRANGMGTMSMMWPILDSNQQTLDYTEQDIMPAIAGDAFVCACLNANDPLRDMRTVLERLKSMGVMSVSNIGPSISYVDKDSNIYKVLVKSGVTFENGRATQSNFHDYEMVRADNFPEKVTTHIVDHPFDVHASGVGEPGVPPVAPAIANAIFNATGKRIRSLPFGDTIDA